MSIQQEQAERIKQLEAQLAAKNKLTFKVSDKGAVSVYGLQRFPVTLYGEQWKRIIAIVPDLEKFLEDNKTRLTNKS